MNSMNNKWWNIAKLSYSVLKIAEITFDVKNIGECLLFLAFFVGLCSITSLDIYENNVIQSKNGAKKYHNS